MKIEAEKFYLDAKGNKRGPMLPSAAGELGGFWLEGHGLFREDGTFGYGSIDTPELNLIAEWTDEPAQPTTGTLAELNVQPGDVVQEDNFQHQVVLAINVNEEEPFTLKNLKTGETDTFIGWCNRWSIISRASQSTTPVAHSTTPASPVRTVTRKEIVPGVYGKLTIHQCGDYSISQSTADDLTAAIQTLTDIRDALENP